MLGANWTRRDYEVLADMTEWLMVGALRGQSPQDVYKLVIEYCRNNAAYDRNGNRNFLETRFENRVRELLAMREGIELDIPGPTKCQASR